MTAQLWRYDAHGLTKEAQLVKPLQGIAAIAVYKDQSMRSSFRVDIEDADTA